MSTNGWIDIGYHFLIDRLGNIYQGRPYWDEISVTSPHDSSYVWPRPRFINGAHVTNMNWNNIGISLIGCYDQSACGTSYVTLTSGTVTYNTLRDLVAYLASTYTVAIDATHILGHGQWPLEQTACPGGSVLNDLTTLRTDVSNLLTYGGVACNDATYALSGVCRMSSQCVYPGFTSSGNCAGPADVKCCHMPGRCSDDSGVCVPTTSCDYFTPVSGLCPGGATVKCCRNDCNSKGGNCIDVSRCINPPNGAASELSGLCPGPSNIKCCMP